MEEQQTAAPQPSIQSHQKVSIPLILAGILLLGAGFAGGWYVSSKNQPVLRCAIPLSPTPEAQISGQPEETATSPMPKSYPANEAPVNWSTYNKKFGDAQYIFKYPPEYQIFDQDESSGTIDLLKKGTNTPVYASISTFSNYGYDFDPYVLGSRRVWFTDNMKKLFPQEDFSKFTFEDVTFGNAKSYLYVTGFPQSMGWKSMYFTIDNSAPMFIANADEMNKAVLLQLLSGLTVSKSELNP